ncbi:MAG: hypothetical protein FD167_325 [bacterium]|nr:MAG: hypothetical protein FD167_325 [bacterium]
MFYQTVKTGNVLVKCSFCKTKWLDKEKADYTYGREHVCPKIERVIAKKAHYFDTFILPRLSHLSKEQQDRERYYNSDVQTYYLAISTESIVWKNTFGKEPKPCTGKCLNALSGACECRCKGQNHGLQHLR